MSKELRNGIRETIELLANEVIERSSTDAGPGTATRSCSPRPTSTPRELTRQCLRYLYRLLVLLYAESRPELGILPVDDAAYIEGYSLDRLRELCLVELDDDEARNGSHLHESLDLLFELVNDGYHAEAAEQQLLFDAQRSGSTLDELPSARPRTTSSSPGLRRRAVRSRVDRACSTR